MSHHQLRWRRRCIAPTVRPILFQSLIVTLPEKPAGRKRAAFFVSLALHTLLVLSVAILPILYYDSLPDRKRSRRSS